MAGSAYARLDFAPRARAVVDCGSYSKPDNGCTDERRDAVAAYTDALDWYLSGDDRYAVKAIEIMDAWSGTIRDHTNSNAPVQSGWAASIWVRPAELIRAGHDWPQAGRFAEMLRKVYLPKVVGGSQSNGNWELSMLEATVGIAVFTDGRATYDKAVSMYLDRVPAYIYLSSDGALPKVSARSNLRTPEQIIKYWQQQSTFVDGLAQETCRDFAHTGYGLSAIAHIAETSRIQHGDLYPQVADRLRAAFEFHAKYQLGEPLPENICHGHYERSLGPTTEVAYNALHNRLGLAMPETERLTAQLRPEGADMFSLWETLTHADNPH
ncbi:alginate lyase family protein [Nocardia sp. NBC_01327]|uniref:alginate lyase family protein n=1 Tax=Nocardia sp. NBC_01327 TaxID=2903593 RepID=UPI002E108750|nr:alginate lyase family protein [Nocardia sp. NBC_01327]